MQIVDEFGMEIGGGLVVRTPRDPLHECSCDVFEQA